MSVRVSTTHSLVKTVGGARFLMTPTAFVGLDNGYVALREDFKQAILSPEAFPVKLRVQYRKNKIFGGQENSVQEFLIQRINGRFEIGCHRFDAATKRLIIRWALG